MINPSPRRTFLQWLFRAGLGQPLVSVWVDGPETYAYGQTISEHRVMLGRYTVLRWTKIVTPSLSDRS